jgi:ABC-type multidrug transport system permease subunit
MRNVLEIARNDLRLFLKQRGNLISLLFVPVVMTLVIGIFTGGDGINQLRVDVFDFDHSELSSRFLDSLRQANESLILCPMDNDGENICGLEEGAPFTVQQAIGRVEDTTTLAMIEIPQGFGEDVESFESVEILYRSNEDLSAPGYIRQAVDVAIQRVNGAVVASRVGSDVLFEATTGATAAGDEKDIEEALYQRAASIWEEEPVKVRYSLSQQDAAEADSSLQEGLGQSVPGMGSMFVMLTVFGGMTTLVVEKKQWTLQRIASMPISRSQLLGGKIMARFFLGVLQFTVVFIVGILASIHFGDDLIALLLVMISYTLAITALSFAIGSRVNNAAQASGLSLLLSITLAPLGGAWWPMEVVPDLMRNIGHISPVAWAMDGFNALIFEGGTLTDVLLPILVLLVLALICFGIGIWRFRYD